MLLYRIFRARGCSNLKKKFLSMGIVISFLFLLPSIYYLSTNGSLVAIEKINGFMPLLNLLSSQTLQLFISIFAIFVLGGIMFYIWRFDFFESPKEAFKYIALIAGLFALILPTTSVDVYYYIGVGGLTTYGVNPYLTSIKEFVDAGHQSLLCSDGLINLGYNNFWSILVVVYGPMFTDLIAVIGRLSFHNEFIALYLYKAIVYGVHLLNTYLIYKISDDKKIMVFYGLNPFVLLQYLANGHNDIFVIAFILLAIYSLLKQKKLFLSILFLALAGSFKFITILFLPFFILYHVQKENVLSKIAACIKYGLFFIGTLIILYLPYLSSLEVLFQFLQQRELYVNSIYYLLLTFGGQNAALITKNILFVMFTLGFITCCFYFLFNKDFTWEKVSKTCIIIILVFICLILTNLQIWYAVWIVPFLCFEKTTNVVFWQSIIIEALTLCSNGNSNVAILYIANFVISIIIIGYIKIKKNRKAI